LRVNDMSRNDGTRVNGKALFLACAVITAGLAALGPSAAEAGNPQLAQATPPLQSTPGADTKPSAPAEPSTTGTGTRPSGIPPQPAQPDAEAQKAGAVPALPLAPAEKVAPPIKN
jgi:hypothetical protein